MGRVVAEGADEVERPWEALLHHLSPHDIQVLLRLVARVLHVKDDGGTDEALVDDDAPVGVVRPFDRGLVKAEEPWTDALQKLRIVGIIEQGIDEWVVGFVVEHRGIVARTAHGWVNPVADDGKQVAWLARELAPRPVAIAAAGEVDDDIEAVGGGGAVVELAEPFGMERGHDVGLILLRVVVVERAVLLEELVEARVLVELVKPFHEIVEVDVLPAVVQILAVADEHDFPVVNGEADGHAHHSLVADAVLGADFAGKGYGGVLLVWGEPRLSIIGVLSCKVIGVLLIASRSGEDAHQFNGLRDLNFNLRRRCECGGDDEDKG